ncbi:MAG: ABC transporter ATP-binding protein [Syntrophomonadaceae bacterium]|nr:ABC transporter ATP-binding protein [Syntrophomonadaceae bacterium]
MNAVECRDLTKAYGRLKAVNNLSFVIEENKITGLIGRNGAGKTTLLKVIAGFLQKTAGEVKVFAENPFNNLTVSANTVFIDDNMPFPQSLCLGDLLNSAAGFYRNWDMGLARGMLDYFSLNPKQHYQNLSKGMKSIFTVVMGLSARCSLTIFDEPTAGMDAGSRKDFYRALLKDYLQHPRTIILSSHLLNEIEDVLEDILLIGEGKKILHAPVSYFREYALGLRGKSRLLEDLAKSREVIHKYHVGEDYTYLVVKNDLTEQERHQARLAGVDLTAVSAADLCVYLTAGKKGGIDDVFNKNQFI